jgi:hypothetical protein
VVVLCILPVQSAVYCGPVTGPCTVDIVLLVGLSLYLFFGMPLYTTIKCY